MKTYEWMNKGLKMNEWIKIINRSGSVIKRMGGLLRMKVESGFVANICYIMDTLNFRPFFDKLEKYWTNYFWTSKCKQNV